MQRRKLEELSLMDDFLFNAMLTHPETGEKFTNKELCGNIINLLLSVLIASFEELVLCID